MKYLADSHCVTCNRSLHITGDMNYVSTNSALFAKIHDGHEVILLPLDHRWEGLDNCTEWWHESFWWQTQYQSIEYQLFLIQLK